MSLKIGLCGNIYLETLAKALDVRVPQHDLIIGLPENYKNELSHPAGDFKHLDICILALDWSELFSSWYSYSYNDQPDIVIDHCKETCSEIIRLLQSFRAVCSAKIMIFSPLSQASYATGFITRLLEFSPLDLSNQCQNIFNDMCKILPDIYPVDCEEITSRIGKDNAFSYDDFYTKKYPFSASMTTAIVKHLDAMITQCSSYPLKCIVLDCDNTLWGGIVSEIGMDTIVLGDSGIGKAYKDFQTQIYKLYKQGIILALCSKNNTCDVLETMELHPHMVIRPSMISSFRINWDDKPKNILQISQELNISLQSILFIDDMPHEREMVKSSLPEITIHTLPDNPMYYAHSLQSSTRFWPMQLTKEDTQKSSQYSQTKIRKESMAVAQSVEDFLLQSKIKITISPANVNTLSRISQLFHKTNQFNVTGARYSETQLQEILQSNNRYCFSMEMADKYGDYGIIAACIISNDIIESFVLSCRAFGKKAEYGFMSSILYYFKKRNAMAMKGQYLQTSKNSMAQDFYANAGFTKQESSAKESLWIFDLQNKIPKIPQWLSVNNR